MAPSRPRLAEDFTVVATDLRGYGDSSKPFGDEEHEAYSKQAMAAASVDLAHDEKDREEGSKVECTLLTLWGGRGVVEKTHDVKAVWREYASEVGGDPSTPDTSSPKSGPGRPRRSCATSSVSADTG